MGNDRWESFMVVNKYTGQWDTITGSHPEAWIKAKKLGRDWKVISVVIREATKKKGK